MKDTHLCSEIPFGETFVLNGFGSVQNVLAFFCNGNKLSINRYRFLPRLDVQRQIKTASVLVVKMTFYMHFNVSSTKPTMFIAFNSN